MCMRTIGTPAAAQSGSIAGSRPAETSFTRSAPASRAARATTALRVSTESGTRTVARTARRTGRSRRSSSAAGTGAAPGRVDSAPTSRSAAPSATAAAASAARPGSRCRPPSEKESGVALSTPMRTTRSRETTPERVRSALPAAAGLRRGRGRGAQATVAASVLAEDVVDLGAVEDFALEQRLRHLVQRLEVAPEQQLRPLVGLEDDAPHLGVDLDRGGLGVVDPLREVAAEEDLLLLLAEGHRAELLAHPPLADHLARHLGRALDVV